MVIVLFHLLCILGKYFYNSYRIKKVRALCRAARHDKPETISELLKELYNGKPPSKGKLMFSPPAYLQRYHAAIEVLESPKYEGQLQKIVDFGSAELGFVMFLKNLDDVKEILCVDIDGSTLDDFKYKAKPLAAELLFCRKMPLTIELCEGSVTEPDRKLQKTDAVTCIELIEHLHPDTLRDLPSNIFGYIQPKVVIITTPNADFNILFPNFSGFRHSDHKFEWTRDQFEYWAKNIVARYPCYSVTFRGICYGPPGTEELGACTQMAVFHRNSTEEHNEQAGIDRLFKTVAKYEYPAKIDTRSDEQKIRDEVLYYINYLSYPSNTSYDDITLEKLLSLVSVKYTISMETLRTILEEAGWGVEETENGPIVVSPEHSISSVYENMNEDDLDIVHDNDEWSWNVYEETVENSEEESVLTRYEEPLSVENSEEESMPARHRVRYENLPFDWDDEEIRIVRITESCSVNQDHHLSNRENVNTSRANRIANVPAIRDRRPLEIPCTENWDKEPSVIITENRSVNQEHPQSFDGENLNADSVSGGVSATWNGTAILENPLGGPLVLPSVEIWDEESSVIIAENRSINQEHTYLFDGENLGTDRVSEEVNATYNSLELRDTTNDSPVDSLELPLSRDDEVELRTAQRVGSQVNFYPPLSVSRSSTSPEPLFISANESYNNSSLLNNTFYQSEIPNDTPAKAVKFTGEGAQDTEVCLSEKDYTQENTEMIDVMAVSSSGDNSFVSRPKFTSSPYTKGPGDSVEQRYAKKRRSLISSMNSSVLLRTAETIGEAESGTDSLNNINQMSNNGTAIETIARYATSSNSDVPDSSERGTDAHAQTNVGLENKELVRDDDVSCTEVKQRGNDKFTSEKSVTKHETDVANDVPTMKPRPILPLDSENIEHKEETSCCRVAPTDNIHARTHTGDMISNSSTQSNLSKKSPPRELSSFRSRSDDESSSSKCAKEISSLENNPRCTSNEDAHNIQFAPVAQSDDVAQVGTSRDTSVSNTAGSTDNVEAKPSSPPETPPNSWSPEIMDSGYPNSASAQDITPEYDLSSIAQDHIPDSESPSIAEAPRLIVEPVEVENGDLANNNRDDEGNNMMAVGANDIENLQPLIDVLENDLENENDIYVMQNGFPMWLLRILDMANPIDFDIQARQNLRVPDDVADAVNYAGHDDEGFDSSSENESDVAYNEMENDDVHDT